MPRDIRSYFQNVSTSKPAADASVARPKKRRVISSDEENDDTPSPVKRSKKTKVMDKSISPDPRREDVKQQKLMSPAAMFSSKPITREEAPKISKRTQKEEAKVHNDKDFEATLSQLDTSDIEKKYLEEADQAKDISNDTKQKRVDSNKGGKKQHKVEDEEEGASISKKKRTPDKNTEDSVDDSKKYDGAKRKQSNSSLEEEAIAEDDHKKGKAKKARATPKKKMGASKMEIEHKEPKKKESPKKVQDPYEERAEKRKQHAAAYQQYLQRGGARNPGSKEIPVGANNCLAGLSFLITGVLDSLEREDADELIKKYGGRILHQVSKKTDYVIVGDQPGPAKLEKARSLNIKQISEDDLLEMIRTRPAGKADDIKQPRSKSRDKFKQKSTETDDTSPSPTKRAKPSMAETTEKPPKIQSPLKKSAVEAEKTIVKQEMNKSPKKRSPIKKDSAIKTEEPPVEEKAKSNGIKVEVKPDIEDISLNLETEALVEKYRPKTMKQILGQQGEKSNARKLYNWLTNWHKNQSGQVKHTKPSPWAKNDDGAFFKAALLSGPPGVGKTTTVQVVCNELGFDLIEFNASDTRSKRLLKEEVSELLSNTTLKDYFKDKNTKSSSKHVLLMDEVDGMAGNEDRGGLQELIALIKSTDVPIVCICNDRNNPKMRTLSNYTFDLRFQKPRIEQIRAAMKSICFKEHIDISTEDLDRLIESTNQDIRQVINHLALFAGKGGRQEKTEKKHANKDLKLGPWDVVRNVFSAEEHKHMSIHDKSDLFFHDYSIAPLFVQENYLLVVPRAPKNELLERVAESAESLALGDMVEKSIRNNNAWSLLPVQACYSSVIPGTVMSGHIGGQIAFPAWLGRNSRATKFDRLLQEITVHARLTTGASKEAINLDYLTHLRDAITRPLLGDGIDGVDTAINVMNTYHLLREDLDSLSELSLWPGQRNPMQNVDSKVKAAFTRAYNTRSTAVPYVMNASKKKGAMSTQDEGFLQEEEEDEANSEEDEDNVESDKMIKAKKPTASKKTETKGKSADKAPAKRGRGRGKAK